MIRRDLLLAWVLTLASVGALAIFDASDPDLGFHLATGRAILASGTLPTTNVLSFAEPNQAWVLQQGWPALLFELLWQNGGIACVILVKAVVITATWALVLATTLRLGASPVMGCVVTIFAASSCAFRFVERPLIFSNLALAATAFCVSTAVLGHKVKRWPLAGAGLIAALSCHLHAGAVLCFVFLFSVAADLALGNVIGWLCRKTGSDRGRSAAALTVTALGALGLAAVSLAAYHPFGLRVLLVPFRMATDAYLATHLVEFRPPWAMSFGMLAPYWILLLASGVLVTAGRIPTAWRVALVIFAALSLKHVRLVDAFAIVMAGPFAAGLMTFFSPQGPPARFGAPLRSLAVILAIAAPVLHHRRFPLGLGYNPAIWPLPLFRTVRDLHLKGPAFVSDGWAGPWLAFNYPKEKAYFFPAFDAFSERFVREDYMDVRYGRPGWDLKLNRYGVDLVVLKHTSAGERAFQGGAANLRQHLARDGRWSLVAFDDSGAVFVRNSGSNTLQARALNVPGVDVDRVEIWGPIQPARLALESAWRRGERSQRLATLRHLADPKQ